jgi:hypothetical protein
MESGKTSKYFKYAIGEIILVVIGILIALSINNWNENHIAFKNEQQITSLLLDELDMQSKELSASLKQNNYILKEISSYLDDSFPDTKKDSFNVIRLLEHINVHLKIPLVESIINDTESKSISDKKLVSELRHLNTLNLSIITAESYLDDLWNTKASEFLIRKKHAYSTLDYHGRRQGMVNEAFRKLYNDSEYREIISIKHLLHMEWIQYQVNTLKKLDKILLYISNSKTYD